MMRALVMELVEGDDLSHRAATNQSAKINLVQNWFEDLKARVKIK